MMTKPDICLHGASAHDVPGAVPPNECFVCLWAEVTVLRQIELAARRHFDEFPSCEFHGCDGCEEAQAALSALDKLRAEHEPKP